MDSARGLILALDGGLQRAAGSLLAAGRLPSRRRTLAAHAALVAIGLAVFGGAVRNGFTTWDDDIYVTRNPIVAHPSWEGVGRVLVTASNCNYHPLTTLTYMAESWAGGLDPRLFHLDSVLLHIAASVLAFHLGRRWLSSDGAGFLAALLFLVHPLRVESVAWVAERKDVLCGALYLAALLSYHRHLECSSRLRYAVVLLFFVLALLSKAMAMTFPAAALLVLVSRRDAGRRRLLELLPPAAIAIAFAWIAVRAQAAEGAVQGLHGGGWLEHGLTVFKAASFYAGKLLLPLTLSPRYLMEPARGLIDPAAWIGAGLLTLLGLVAWRSLRGRRTAFLTLGFFAVSWAPVSGIVPTSTIVADRYLYLPAFGLFAGLAGLLSRVTAGPAPARRLTAASAALLLVTCGALAVLAAERVAVWRDPSTLWADALRENPRNPFAQNQLFVAHYEAGRYAEAEGAAREAIALGLREPRHLYNLCLAYRGLGDSRRELETARGIVEGAPGFTPAWTVVLRHEREAGRHASSKELCEKLLAGLPEDAALWVARGDLAEAEGDPAGALLAYVRSIELRPGDPEALLGAAAALLAVGDAFRAFDLAGRTLSMPGGVLHLGAAERLDLLVERAERSGREDWAGAARRISGMARRPQQGPRS